MTEAPAPARVTPFELGLPDSDFARARFDAFAQEAGRRGMDPADPGAFLLLAQVGRTVHDLQEGEGGGALLHSFGAFLYHAFHFERAGRPLFLVEAPLARFLVEGDPAFAGYEGALPAAAGYIQLPRHLFWARPDGDEGPAEPLDGIFWTRAVGEALCLLAVTGIRPGRAGFSVLPVPAVPLGEAVAWMGRSVRETGRDFETVLPGGELERLYSIEAIGELLKLAARVCAHAVTVPEALGSEERVREEGASALAFRRLRL